MSQVARYGDKRQVPIPYAPGGCPVEVGEEKCGETEGLDIIKDFHQLYQEKMSEIDVSAGGDSLQEKVDLQQKWINDLTEQNKMLAKVIEELETEAIGRLQQLENKLKNAAKSFGEEDKEALAEKDRKIKELEEAVKGLPVGVDGSKDKRDENVRLRPKNEGPQVGRSGKPDESEYGSKELLTKTENEAKDKKRPRDRQEQENLGPPVLRSGKGPELEYASKELLPTDYSKEKKDPHESQEEANRELSAGKERKPEQSECATNGVPPTAEKQSQEIEKPIGRQKQENLGPPVLRSGKGPELEYASKELLPTDYSKEKKDPHESQEQANRELSAGKEREEEVEYASWELIPTTYIAKKMSEENDIPKEKNKEPSVGKDRESEDFVYVSKEVPSTKSSSQEMNEENVRNQENGPLVERERKSEEFEPASEELSSTKDNMRERNDENDRQDQKNKKQSLGKDRKPSFGKDRKSEEFEDALKELPPTTESSKKQKGEIDRPKQEGKEVLANEDRKSGEIQRESVELLGTIDVSNKKNEENNILKKNMEEMHTILIGKIEDKQDKIYLLEHEIHELEEKIIESQNEASLKDDLIKEMRNELKKMRNKLPYTDREKITSNFKPHIAGTPERIASEAEFITINNFTNSHDSNHSTLIFIRKGQINELNDHKIAFDSSDSSECGLNGSMALKKEGLVHSCCSENDIKEINWMKHTKERSRFTKIHRNEDMESNEFDYSRKQKFKKLSIPKHIPVKTHVNNIEYSKNVQ